MGLDNRLISQPSQKPLISKRPSPSTIAQHWLKTLAGCECAPYPTLPAFVEQPVADRQTEYAFPSLTTLSRPITISTLVHAAWAIISGQMTDSSDVVFGATRSGGNIIPVRLQLDANQKVSQYLKEAQWQVTDATRFDRMELREIAQISPDCQKACAFQTVLAVEQQNGRAWETEDSNSLRSLSTYGLTIHIQPTAAQIFARASFDSRVIEPSVAFKLLRRLEFVMQQLNDAGPSVALADLAMISPLDLDQIREWNSGVPPVVDRCIHDIVRERILAEPDAPAVCAWDGGLTYRELENLSAKLASHLVDLGVGPERVVPLCFAKSMWTVVAMLSVLKAGGAFVLLDPGLPEDRVRGICQKVNAATGITSPSCESRLSPFTRNTVVLCKQTMDYLKLQDMERRVEMPKTNPQNAAYIIFTSGSTGEPKGCVIEHRSYCSAAFGHGKILGMSNSTRALQFGSYNFAGAIMEMVMTLIYGGCICIPSEEERASNLAQVIGKLNANWAFLTSTVLALISPATAPSLRTVCVGGEPIRSSQIREWAPSVTLRQTFGSAETAAVVSSAGLDSSSAVTSVGKATTAKCWLVHSGDVNQLVPIGAPGEVIFEGPVIGRHYIGDPEKSAKAFISAPSWRAPLGPIAPSSRFYRMGDLGAYRSDGSFELLGRKDTQVKLRGQRIELGEIEHQARLSSTHVKEVAVELSIVGDRGPNLIGFLVLQGDQQKTSSSDDRVRTAIKTVKARLQSALPHYMVPSMLFCIPALPLTASGKTDRRRLREMGSALAVKQESQPKVEVEKVQPSTQIEHQLQQIWTKVLSIKPATIGINDSFFELGGDSITAMKAVGEARKLGINLMVADIFRQDTIAGLAHQLQSSSAAPISQHFEEAALVEPSLGSALLEEIDSSDVGVRSGDVAHVYPMTYVQETIAETGIVFRQLADYYYLDVSPKLDISMLESRCLRALEGFPILRSCFLRLQGKFWHVVLHKLSEPFRVLDVSGDMDEFLRDFSTQDMDSLSPSQPLVAFFLLRHNTQGMRLVIRMSHSQYDAFSAPLIFQSLFDGEQATEVLAAPGYSTYQSYAIRRRSQSIEFWSRCLQGSHPTLIVPQLNPRLNNPTSTNEKIFIEAEAHLPSRFAKITAATLVRTAWCALVSRMTGVTDMICCQVVGGRNSRLRGVEKTIGCCLNVNPDRVNLSASGTVAELVQTVQDNMIAVAEADSLDFNDIVEHCTDWSLASAFDTVLHHRDVEVNPVVHTGEGVSKMKMVEALPFFPFIFLVSFSKGDNIGIHLLTSSHVIPAEAANALAGNLARVIERLVGSMDMPVLSFMDGLRSVV